LDQPNECHHSPSHIDDGPYVNRPQMANPVVIEVSHVMHRQRDGQTHDGHDHGKYPRPPQTIAHPYQAKPPAAIAVAAMKPAMAM
jgi:hypothetical protein